MAAKLPDLKAEAPKQTRSFKWMIGFSVAAVVAFYGRVALTLWGRKELGIRLESAGSDEAKVGAATEFLQQIRVGEQLCWLLLTACCMGFLISAVFWIRGLKSAKASEGRR